jgi:hypothetical protein
MNRYPLDGPTLPRQARSRGAHADPLGRDDPAREGLLDTPKRVAKAYEEFFAGYGQDPREILARTFTEVEGYDEMIVMNDIRFESHCEHHMVPIIGKAHVGYLPTSASWASPSSRAWWRSTRAACRCRRR